MRSDKFLVRHGEAESAMNRVEHLATCYSFPPKEVLHIRLLAEEIISVVEPTLSISPGRCWVSTDNAAFSLTIDCDTGVKGLDYETKKRLMKLGSRNDANKSIFGMISKALEYLTRTDADPAALAGQPLFYMDGMGLGMHGYIWNPNFTQIAFAGAPGVSPDPQEPAELADRDLELKIIEGVADDIKVCVQHSPTGPRLEITVYKRFAPDQIVDIEF